MARSGARHSGSNRVYADASKLFRVLSSVPAKSALASLATWTLAACIVIVFAITLLKVAQLGPLRGFVGFFQRIVLVTYFGWTFAFAANLRRRLQTSETI